MEDNYMESLARAYNEKLRGIMSPDISAVIDAIEEQLALLEGLCPQRKRLLSYLRSLKQSIYSALTAENKTIPSYRSFTPDGGLNRIIDLELELFIALDTVRARSDNSDYIETLDNIIAMETRFTALLGNLR